MKKTTINSAKATPQAPLSLRAGAKARAAEVAAPPAEGDAADQDPNDMAACAEMCRTASAACTATAEQLDKCATELEGGTDSISTLKATEDACGTAEEALDAAAAGCAGLRGAEPMTDSEPMGTPAPAAPGAGPVARAATAPTVQGHIEVAKLAQLGRAVMKATGETTPDRALGAMNARFQAAAEVPELRRKTATQTASAEAAERTSLLEQAIALGTAPALVYDFTEGPKGEKVRSETEWAKGQSNEQLTAFIETSKTLGGFGLAAQRKTPESLTSSSAAGLTQAELAYCAQTGRDPAAFARTKSSLFGASSAGKEA